MFIRSLQYSACAGRPGASTLANIEEKTPVVERKGLFSSDVVFLTYAPHLQ